MNSKKLNAKDFITVGIFTAITFAIEMALGMLGYLHPYIIASYVVFLPLVQGIPMMLFYTYLGAPAIIVVGLIADLVARSGGYKSAAKTVISNGLMSLWICANYIPVVITVDSYRKDLIDGGFSSEYCDGLFRAVNSKTIFILAAVCFVFGVIGALIGKRVVKKHFEKAGIV